MDKYVSLRLLTWMMKPLDTAPLEQESESLTMVFLMPEDVLRMPWHTGYSGECMQKRQNVLRFKTWRFFYMIVHVLLHLFNEMRKIDNM